MSPHSTLKWGSPEKVLPVLDAMDEIRGPYLVAVIFNAFMQIQSVRKGMYNTRTRIKEVAHEVEKLALRLDARTGPTAHAPAATPIETDDRPEGSTSDAR